MVVDEGKEMMDKKTKTRITFNGLPDLIKALSTFGYAYFRLQSEKAA